jgi:tRNA threonylcarbamoyladenosine biosynthesis protein TsaE
MQARYVCGMSPPVLLSTPEATAAFAARLASGLAPGDTLLLAGPLGSGKSHFARSVIHALQAAAGQPPEDVPSPTFTLVQTYTAGPTEIWHADLYRLSAPDEVFELGLDAAWQTAICLIEWPDRLGADAPRDAVTLNFSYSEATDDTRGLTLTGGRHDLRATVERALHD